MLGVSFAINVFLPFPTLVIITASGSRLGMYFILSHVDDCPCDLRRFWLDLLDSYCFSLYGISAQIQCSASLGSTNSACTFPVCQEKDFMRLQVSELNTPTVPPLVPTKSFCPYALRAST